MFRKFTTLEEDFAQLGIKRPNLLEQVEKDLKLKPEEKTDRDSIDESAGAYKCESCGEVVRKSSGEGEKEEAASDQQYPPAKCPKCGKAGLKPYVVPSEKKEDNDVDGVDPLDSPIVNHEMFEAIKGLPFSSMAVEAVDKFIEELKTRELPEDASDGLKMEAQEVVDLLFAKREELSEGPIAGRSKRRKAGGAARGAMKKRASKGFHMKDGKAVKVKPGEAKRKAREKKMWARGGAGKKSATKSSRMAKRFGESFDGRTSFLSEDASPFARELSTIIEGEEENNVTVRYEIMERIQFIFDMLNEEFRDDDVAAIFEEAFGGVVAAWDAGRLDEDVMEDDDFVGEIKPVLTLIQKSLDRIDTAERGELGN